MKVQAIFAFVGARVSVFAWLAPVALATITMFSTSPVKAGEAKFGHLNTVTHTTMNVDGKSWTDYTKVRNSTQVDLSQVDLSSDQPATLGFNVSGSTGSNPTFTVWGQVGSPTVDPVIQLNISTANLTEKGGSNLNLSGVTTTSSSFSGVYGIQEGTDYAP